MADLGTTVFSFILPDNREGMEYALENLTIDHFRDGVQRTFWNVLSSFGERYGDVFPAAHLSDLLSRNGVDPGKALLYTETYAAYAANEVAESAFRYAIDGLRSDLDRFETGEVITTAFEILETGKEVDGVLLSGHAAAREYFHVHAAAIEERSVVEDAPEGDLRDEGDRLIALYTEREAMPAQPGVTFGIAPLDEATSGVQPGELVLLAAYTNEGKSHLLAQLAWDACVVQHKNVFFATSETVRDTTMRRILSRHSRLPQFGLPEGLNAKAIQNGTLTARQREVYFEVVRDFTGNPDIGLCHISQIPRGATMTFLDQRATRVNRRQPLDLVCVDYLQLLKAVSRRASEREEYNEILRDVKVWAPSFDKGRGVPVVSPWQIRQSDYKTALTTSGYTLAALADTSEAEKTPDLIISLLRPDPRGQEASVQVLKARDGPVLGPTVVHLDYRCSYIGELRALGESLETLAVSGRSSLDLDRVLGG